jgi:transcriptional regulator with XRE-family HTH domain
LLSVAHRETDDEIFGSNLRAIRERQGMSQVALAEAMTERGSRWVQQTVAQTEAGKRPPRFTEARHLAEILRTSTDRFTWEGPEANETLMVNGAAAQLLQRYEAVADAVFVLLLGQDRVARVLAQTGDSKYERVQEAREDAAYRAGMYSLRYAVGKGIRKYRERGTAEEEDGG